MATAVQDICTSIDRIYQDAENGNVVALHDLKTVASHANQRVRTLEALDEEDFDEEFDEEFDDDDLDDDYEDFDDWDLDEEFDDGDLDEDFEDEDEYDDDLDEGFEDEDEWEF